jgi:hypothetical protein
VTVVDLDRVEVQGDVPLVPLPSHLKARLERALTQLPTIFSSSQARLLLQLYVLLSLSLSLSLCTDLRCSTQLCGASRRCPRCE